MVAYILTFCVSLVVVAFSIPTIITISLRKRLFDAPNETRKIHKKIIPNLGGLAIFSGFLFSLALCCKTSDFPIGNQLLASGVILFIIGLKDDIIGVDPLKKFVAQFAAAFIITILGDIRIMDLQGILGVHTLAYPFSIGLSVFTIVGIVNAFNLIDGIDGLAGSLGLIMSIAFFWLFYSAGETGWALLSLSLAGALIGFLIHNVSPARIFMGDSGSLMIGFISAVCGIHLINISTDRLIDAGVIISSAPALVVAILIIPMFDTLRVFTIRIVSNESPFKADSNHLHHRLLSVGLNHTKASAVLAGITLACIALTLYFQDIGNNQLIGTIALLIILLNIGFTFYIYSRKIRLASKTETFGQDANPEQPITDKSFVQSVLEKISEN
ncbi:MraY family glycosyltransferase [Pedobacter sp. SYSU D00535]|uniref:MraY family glycosyltransferase n=1 Tax=Pedobacter sp. SYSU D00535 TaxID=2810308 RepID=UPI001A97A1CC|nr:MraY family glycosyltransferase [Pedobacter sp. SYSU D00535]